MTALQDIRFPVFNLRGIEKTWEDSNILYVKTVYDTYILDNKNLKGDILGERRLRVTGKLYKLGKCIENFSVLANNTYTNKLFIDSDGILFKYLKTVVRPVKYFKVKKVHKTEQGKVLELYGTSVPYLLKRGDAAEYIGLVLLSESNKLLYELSDTHKDEHKVWI